MVPHLPGARGRLTRNAAVLSVAEAITRGVAIVSSVIVARLLGPSLLGDVAIAQSVVLYLAVLSDGGLTQWTERQIVKRPAEVSRLVWETTAVQVGLAVVASLLIGLIAAGAPFPTGTAPLLLVAAPFAITQAFSLLYVFQAYERMLAAATIKIVTAVTSAAGTIVLVTLTREAAWAVVSLWLGQLLGDIIGIFLLTRRHAFHLTRISFASVASIVNKGTPFLGTAVLYSYSLALPTIFLGLLGTAEAVGEFSAAARLVGTAQFFAIALTISAYPEMVRRLEAEYQRFADLVTNVLRIAARLTFAGAALAGVEATDIVRLLYGTRFAPAAVILQILAVTLPAAWYVIILSQTLYAGDAEKLALRVLAVSAGLATLITPAGAALFGPIGVAATVLAVMCFQATMLGVYCDRLFGVQPLRTALREAPYAFVPVVALVGWNAGAGHPSFVLTVTVWLIALLAVEVGSSLPTLRGLTKPGW